MELKQNDKDMILKTFTAFLKKVNGKGPQNIFIKYIGNEIHIHLHGVISDFEKYLIKNFGQEAIDTFEDFYQRDCKNAEMAFTEMLACDYTFQFKELKTDFKKDAFVYKMILLE